jgi:subtilisin family serine protease
VRVAVIDSRVDVDHPDLAGQVVVSRDFLPNRPGEPESHGTAVAGIIAAIANNHVGIAGIAPEARVMALRACWQERADTVCDSLSLARAINFAIENRAQVVNLSLSGPAGILLSRLVDVAIARGAAVVAAVDPAQPDGGFPASHAGVIAVTRDDSAARLQGVYTAPGHDVPTTLPHGRWSLVSGSSFAAAHVSGLLALVREKSSRPRAGELVAVSMGRVDACATLRRVAQPCPCDCALAAAPRAASLR